MNPKAFGEASERVAERFTRAMNAATSPLGALTDIPLATALCSLPMVVGLRRTFMRGGPDSTALVWLGLASLPLFVLVVIGLWLRLGARERVVRWLSEQPFPIDNVNGLLAGVGDSLEIVFSSKGSRRAPDRAELQPKLDEVSDDALVLKWPDQPAEGEEGEPDEAARTVVIGLGVVPSKHFPYRTAHLRYRRFQELVERVLVPLHGERRLEGVRVL